MRLNKERKSHKIDEMLQSNERLCAVCYKIEKSKKRNILIYAYDVDLMINNTVLRVNILIIYV